MEQGCLTSFELSEKENIQEGGDVGFADACRLKAGHILRNRHEMRGIGCGVLRIAAASHERHDLLTDIPA